MRERLDCAILSFGDMADWDPQKEGSYAKGRLHLHRVQRPAPGAGDIHALADMAPSLQRFDVCLLMICEENLAWIRQAMLAARPELRVPIIGLVRNLKAAAIGDLYNLGMAAFIRDPLCIEEVRIRTVRVLDRSRLVAGVAYSNAETTCPCSVHDGSRVYGQRARHGHAADSCDRCVRTDGPGELIDSNVHRQPGKLELEAFAIASASHCAGSAESFSAAKNQVVGCFERAYIRASLAKASGNIAMAARGAKKHRRAYWALMRKHNIDAAPYRNAAPPDQ